MWADNESFGGLLEGDFQEDSDLLTPRKSGDRVQNLIPMLAKHINNLNISNGNITFFDRTLHLIRVCGILKSQELSSTKATYVVEDFSGSIDVMYWLNQVDDGAQVTPQVMTGTYVDVVGSIRSQNDRLIVMAISMATVKNLNIPTSHIIEAVHARYMFERGLNCASEENAPMETSLGNSMIMDSKQNNKLTAFEMQVLNFIKSVDSSSGCPLDVIKDSLRCSNESVEAATKRLNSEGHIYSTKNEYTFRVTDLN